RVVLADEQRSFAELLPDGAMTTGILVIVTTGGVLGGLLGAISAAYRGPRLGASIQEVLRGLMYSGFALVTMIRADWPLFRSPLFFLFPLAALVCLVTFLLGAVLGRRAGKGEKPPF